MMLDAPETIWIMPTRWNYDRVPEIDWTKGDWHTLQSKSPFSKPYVKKSALDAVVAERNALREQVKQYQLAFSNGMPPLSPR